MQAHYDGRADSRGTILVASSHTLFTDLVGEMVERCGFAAAYPASGEAPWLSLTRTQPSIVICDCSAPAEGIQRLIQETSSRGIPLVLSDARTKQRSDDGSLVLPQQVAWLTFPVTREAFVVLLDEVLRPPAESLTEPTSAALPRPASEPARATARARSARSGR